MVLFAFAVFVLNSYFRDYSLRAEFYYCEELGSNAIKLQAEVAALRLGQAPRSRQLDIDISSPGEKILLLLQSIRGDSSNSSNTNETITQVLALLSMHTNIQSPNIEVQLRGSHTLDMDTGAWLLSSVANRKKFRSSSSVPVGGKTSSTSDVLKIGGDPAAWLDSAPHGLSRFFESLLDWNFDMFSFASVTDARPLYYMVYLSLRQHNLIELLNIDVSRLTRFISRVEELYRPLPCMFLARETLY